MYFTVLITPSIKRTDFYSGFTISIMSSLSLFEVNKNYLFPTFTSPFPVFFPNLYSTFEVAFEAMLLNNRVKTSLAKRTARFVTASLSNVLPKLAKTLSEVPKIHLIELF